jgi:3-oxoacyl-[acyl-carrier protein] reductase
MLLQDRTAIVYGGGGSIGGAVARAFAREGARVFLAGRTRSRLESVAPLRGHHLGGLQTAFHAIEAMRRQLSSELGPHGIRAVTLRTGGVPESIPEGFAARDEISRSLEEMTMLGRTATLADVGDVAAFVASDRARTMTAATVNVSCGALID